MTLDIFSKSDGPRAEDVKAKRMISGNLPVIRKLADQISNGGFTRMRQQQADRAKKPQAEGLMIYDMKARLSNDVPEPYIKMSLNNRVVLADKSTGRQIQLIGEIRGGALSRKLILATKDNGFISPLDDEVLEAIGHLDGIELTSEFSDDDLAGALECLLGLREET